MSKDTKIKLGQYSINKARLFENDRGLIGFDLILEFEDKVIGSVSHDGNGMTYNYHFEPSARAQHQDIVTDLMIEALLEANGL